MLVIKLQFPRKAPQFMHLVRVMDNPGHALHGHMLVNTPLHTPFGWREARWIDPKDVEIWWIREFVDDPR